MQDKSRLIHRTLMIYTQSSEKSNYLTKSRVWLYLQTAKAKGTFEIRRADYEPDNDSGEFAVGKKSGLIRRADYGRVGFGSVVADGEFVYFRRWVSFVCG